eukprot:6206922-Pleurochrysis_carterae.AAC.5
MVNGSTIADQESNMPISSLGCFQSFHTSRGINKTVFGTLTCKERWHAEASAEHAARPRWRRSG